VDGTRTWAWVAGRLRPPAALLGWFYVAIVVWLMIWLAVPWAVLGWEPRVVGADMGPTLHPGDVVLLDPAATGPLAPGSVVATARGDVVQLDGQVAPGRWQTRAGGEITDADVAGVGRLLVPAVASPLVWLRQGRGVPILLLLLVTVAAGWALSGRGGRGGRARPRRRPRPAVPRPAWTSGHDPELRGRTAERWQL